MAHVISKYYYDMYFRFYHANCELSKENDDGCCCHFLGVLLLKIRSPQMSNGFEQEVIASENVKSDLFCHIKVHFAKSKVKFTGKQYYNSYLYCFDSVFNFKWVYVSLFGMVLRKKHIHCVQ